MVSVFDERVIEERPWYVAYEEGAEIPADPTAQAQEPAAEEAQPEVAEKPKRKTWKDAVAEKAQELEGAVDGNKVDSEGNQEAGSAAPAAGDSAGQADSSKDAGQSSQG